MLNIFPKFIILYIIIFYIYNKLYINCEPVCSDFTDCFNCTMCGDENSKYCNCVWEPDIGGEYICQTDEFRYLSEWYKELKQCKNNLLQKLYCSGGDTIYTRDDLDSEYSLTFQISNDNYNNYGKNMMFCYYNYIDETSSDYILDIQFSNSLANKPKVVYGCSFTEDDQSKIQLIEENKEISCTGGYNIFFMVLLKDEYSSSPIFITIKLNNATINKYVTGFSIVIIILIIITCIICCITRFYNNKARRQLRLLMNQRARENMLRIQQENDNMNNYNENSENIEEINKEKLDILFSKKMAEHYYKSEYNQYGGGCSICLENFKKKSKVSMTPCNHVFHYKCIKDWLYKNVKNPKCPNCNKEVIVDVQSSINEKIDEQQVIQVKKKQPNNNFLNNNLNFSGRNNISVTTNINNRGGRGDFSQSQRQYLGEY